MPRRLAITKRVNLEGIGEGWTTECFALVTPANYNEFIGFTKLQDEGKSNTELVEFQLDFVKKHYVSGKVLTLNDENEQVVDDMQSEDIDESKALADKLFGEIVGINLDPKDTSIATETSPTQTPSTEQ